MILGEVCSAFIVVWVFEFCFGFCGGGFDLLLTWVVGWSCFVYFILRLVFFSRVVLTDRVCLRELLVICLRLVYG